MFVRNRYVIVQQKWKQQDEAIMRRYNCQLDMTSAERFGEKKSEISELVIKSESNSEDETKGQITGERRVRVRTSSV